MRQDHGPCRLYPFTLSPRNSTAPGEDMTTAIRASIAALSGLIATFWLPAALLSGFSAAKSAEARACPQEVRWIMWLVKGVSYETGDRVAEHAWDKASQNLTDSVSYVVVCTGYEADGRVMRATARGATTYRAQDFLGLS